MVCFAAGAAGTLIEVGVDIIEFTCGSALLNGAKALRGSSQELSTALARRSMHGFK